MADLTTKYMGLTLRNPIIIASSGLTDSYSKIADLERNGAGAVVLKSLFEEQILLEAKQNLREAIKTKKFLLVKHRKKSLRILICWKALIKL